MGLAMAFQALALASHGLAWTSQGLDLASQGLDLAFQYLDLAFQDLDLTSQVLARAFQHLAWASLGLAQASGGADGWADEQNFSPFYRILSPIEAAALLYIHVIYQILKQGKGTTDHVMPQATGYLFLCSKYPYVNRHLAGTKHLVEKSLDVLT